jgi:hypothetical protein
MRSRIRKLLKLAEINGNNVFYAMKSKKSPKTEEKPPVFIRCVSGEITDACPPGLVFGKRAHPPSRYGALLALLRDSPGKYLKFEHLRARCALGAHARRMNLKILFAQEGPVLWVSLAPPAKELPVKAAKTLPGRTMDVVPEETPDEEAPKPAPTIAELALQAITAKRTTAGEIITFMRSRGYTNGLDLTGTENLLRNLCKEGKIKLKPLPRGADTDQPDRWMVA